MTLPTGWVARQLASTADPTWCFALESPAGAASTVDCRLWFRALLHQPSDTIEAGFEPSCDSQPEEFDVVESGVRTFGGRSAIYAESMDTCGSNPGAVNDVTEYIVATSPAYALYSHNTDAKVRTVLAELVANSKLPAQLAPLPYYIQGDIEWRSHHADGYHVRLQPVIPTYTADGVELTPIGHLIGLVIADSLVTDNAAALIGQVEVFTDGSHVTRVTIDGG